MNITNYHPDIIERDFNEMKEQIERNNEIAKKKHRLTIFIMLAICIALLTSSILSTVYLCNNANIINYQIVFIIISVILWAAFVVLLILLVGVLCNGPNTVSLTYNMTFAMDFWNLYSKANILNVEVDVDAPNCIIITYENENHFVREQRLMSKGIIMSTEAKEEILDVGRGYIVRPYQPGEKPKIIND